MLSNVAGAEAPEEDLLSVEDLFDRYPGRIPRRTNEYWRYSKKGPPFIKIGQRVFYPLAGVIAWERQRMIHADLLKQSMR